MFKVMKQNQSNTETVFPFSLKEVCTFSGENLATKTAGQNTSDNKSGDKEKPLQASLPSEKEIAAKLTEIEQKAYEQGFASGEKAGHASGVNKLKPLRQVLLNIAAEMEDLKERTLKECKENIVAMALAMTRRILGHEVETSAETLFGYIEKGIRKIGEEERLVIRLHPHDIGIVTQSSASLTTLLESGKRFRFEADHSLSSGECIIEGRERVVDARPKTQLAIFEAALMETNAS